MAQTMRPDPRVDGAAVGLPQNADLRAAAMAQPSIRYPVQLPHLPLQAPLLFPGYMPHFPYTGYYPHLPMGAWNINLPDTTFVSSTDIKLSHKKHEVQKIHYVK